MDADTYAELGICYAVQSSGGLVIRWKEAETYLRRCFVDSADAPSWESASSACYSHAGENGAGFCSYYEASRDVCERTQEGDKGDGAGEQGQGDDGEEGARGPAIGECKVQSYFVIKIKIFFAIICNSQHQQ